VGMASGESGAVGGASTQPVRASQAPSASATARRWRWDDVLFTIVLLS
jgi:hypothetical protein